MAQPTIRPKSNPPPSVTMQRVKSTMVPSAGVDMNDDELVTMETNRGEPPAHGNGITKNGLPDRRLKGQRDLPEVLPNPDYIKPTTAIEDEQGIHRTKDGKPDRRYLEARAISEEEAKVMQAEYIIATSAKPPSSRPQ